MRNTYFNQKLFEFEQGRKNNNRTGILMNCLTEEKIEQYILGLYDFVDTEIQHIVNCDRCRERYEFLKDMYTELRTENVFELAPDFTEKAIIMKPLKSQSEPDSYNYKLAAQSEKGQQKFIVHHFSNEDEEIIGRILHEKETHDVTLYLLAENKEKIGGQRVKILDTGLEAITDENGVASFGKQNDFSCKGIKIESPLAIFDLQPLKFEKKLIDEKHVFKLKNKNHDEIYIEVDQNQVNKSYRISLAKVKGASEHKELQICILTNTNKMMSRKIEKGVSVFETETDEQILKIHIY